MFKYLLIGLIAYWVFKRVFKVADAVKQDRNPPQSDRPSPPQPNKKPNIDHSKGGEYVDYEEVE
ncbi:MAG: hypothetical protein ACI9AU_000808 [Bacteroidia bacterium]|jgi:hypothetical protein